MFCFLIISLLILPTHSHMFFHFQALPSQLPLCHSGCAVLHYVTLCNRINGSIVQILKVASCSFIKVHCFPQWNNKSLCVSQWATDSRQKDATSSHANTRCTASGVFLMTQHVGLLLCGFVFFEKINSIFFFYHSKYTENDFPLMCSFGK